MNLPMIFGFETMTAFQSAVLMLPVVASMLLCFFFGLTMRSYAKMSDFFLFNYLAYFFTVLGIDCFVLIAIDVSAIWFDQPWARFVLLRSGTYRIVLMLNLFVLCYPIRPGSVSMLMRRAKNLKDLK